MPSRLLVGGEMLLYGDVGDPFGFGDGFTARDVAEALAENGPGDITVRINSGGGIAIEGMAINSLLQAHEGDVTVAVDGVAASAASLIAMAGDRREMRDGATMMIHDPRSLSIGTEDDHRAHADVLGKLSDNYARVYARASGKTEAEARSIMKAETWLTADEAVDEGFADAVIEDKADAFAAFDYRVYAHAPKGLPRPRRAGTAQAVRTQFAQANLNALLPDRGERVASRNNPPAMIGTKGKIMSKKSALPNGDGDTVVVDKPKPWANSFFLSAENSGLELAALNAIVTASDSHDVARDTLIDAMAQKRNATLPNPNGGHHNGVTLDNPDNLGEAISGALYSRLVGKAPEGAAREFASCSIVEMACEWGRANGVRGLSRRGSRDVTMLNRIMEARMEAAGTLTTSDFPTILGNTLHRFLLEQFKVWESPLLGLAREVPAVDFRPVGLARLGEATPFAEMGEASELTYGSLGEEKSTLQVKTYAKGLALSRQAIINDDLSAFSDGGRAIGYGAAQAMNKLLTDMFLANSGDGADLDDGNPLYSTARGNKAGVGWGDQRHDARRCAPGAPTDERS